MITGQTGQFDELGQPLIDSALASLIGARITGRLETEDNWVSVDVPLPLSDATTRLAMDLRPEWRFMVKGPAAVYQPTTATGFGKLYSPERTNRQIEGKMNTQWPMSAGEPRGPAILINRVGKGVVATCAASPDHATASDHALVEDRLLFRNMFRVLQPDSRVAISAPANIEAVVTDDSASRTIRIHLLAYNATPRTTPSENRPYILPGLIEDLPIFRVTVATDFEIRDHQALHPTTAIRTLNRSIEATIEEIHEVLLVRY
jgi:hypothetical protein